ncbi:hypothetical protein DRE_07169 [Drechslerella stenobrocha 248]|uniref:CUE domain-containing protein n=1 Tax=Drechslerella stenobrocha 248 TaxID=1043628 RepID=W7HVN6_9PEZI|nr:hypothetical protein DRE_07169 [Drechslerella stenobrocha 248]
MSLASDDLAGSSSSSSLSSSINLPQFILCALVAALVYRYVISSPPSSIVTSPSHGRPTRPANAAVSADAIRALQSMFPQASIAAIRWELERNGGSLEIATEKILAEGSLPEPPLSPTRRAAQAPSPNPRSNSGGTTEGLVASASGSPVSKLGGHTDLISRYNLHSKLTSIQLGPSQPADTVFANKKNDKASLMLRGRERRDAMILQARRKMETMLRHP